MTKKLLFAVLLLTTGCSNTGSKNLVDGTPCADLVGQPVVWQEIMGTCHTSSGTSQMFVLTDGKVVVTNDAWGCIGGVYETRPLGDEAWWSVCP